jgi:urea transport system permease protein
MAHGELVMIGAYTAVLAGIYLNLNLFLALPLAFFASAFTGLALEAIVIRRLYGRILDTLLATWGVAILLQQLIRLEFGLSFFGIHVAGLGPGLQNMSVPSFLSEVFSIGGVTVQPYRSFIIILTICLTLLTWYLLYKTSIGIQLRAIMRNPQIAAACGIDVKRISALTFAYGSGLAGVAGVLLAGFKTVTPSMGAAVVVDGFLVVVVGGVGSLLGTVLSAALLGQINGLFAILSNDIVARAIVFGVVIALILIRPNGLFNFKSR